MISRRCLICANINPCREHSEREQQAELDRNDAAIAALSAEAASPQSGPTLALDEPNTELGATRGEGGDVFGATNEELADYIRDQVCCPRIHGCELGGSPECPAERVRAALSTPKTPSQGREEIARILFPHGPPGKTEGWSVELAWDDALRKADLILAALSAPSQGSEWINLDVLPFWPWLWADPFRDDVGTRKEMAERRLRANYEVARDPIPNQYALVHRADLISQMHELWTLRARVSAAPPSPEGVSGMDGASVAERGGDGLVAASDSPCKSERER